MPTPFQQHILGQLREEGHDIDVTGGGVLKEGGSELADMFRATTVKQGRGAMAWRMFQTMAHARHAWPVNLVRDVTALTGAFVRERHREPKDTDYLRGRDEQRTWVVQDFVRRMLAPGSGFANPESRTNFQNAMEMHRSGEDVTWEIIPHSSEMDPVLMETIVRQEGAYGEQQMRRDAQQFLAQNIIVIGHKVRLSTFHRIFAGAVNSISIYAPKYREGLTPDEEPVMSAYSDVVNRIMCGIHGSSQMMMTRCPEGGRMTRDRVIGVYGAVEPPPARLVPVHVEAPHNFMGVDEAADESHRPAVVKLYVGEPLEITGSGPSQRANNRVHQMHGSLARVNADVDAYAWAIKKLVRPQPGQAVDRSKGVPETYRVVIAKKNERRRGS
ncbi:MAG TPA: hypothetical protein PKV72_04760 [Candidatus Peribacteria bacterium]|nr:hypothetical protein [Candidatus Peribacteria bacterium]